MILVIDNYDSFTHNLVRYLQLLGHETQIIRNDATAIDQLTPEHYSHLLISPGPGHPDDSKLSLESIQHFAGRIPIFGVCLGLQCMVRSFGGQVTHHLPMHGKSALVHHHEQGVFQGLHNPFPVGRYHSLAASQPLPEALEMTAWVHDEKTTATIVMGIKHRQLPLEAVQFHPESVLTQHGLKLLANFFGQPHTRFFNL